MSEVGGSDPHPLDPVLRPRSVAVVGASADPTKRGNQILRALAAAGFRGAVYPVNPKGGVIEGIETYTAVAELPEAPDLAVISLPAAAVPDALEACGAKGVGAALVLAVGFGESGEEGERLAQRLRAIREAHGIRIVGPNTSGLLDTRSGLNLIGALDVPTGGLSLLVQSGNIALASLREIAARTREGLSICVGVGNELDIGFHEYLDFLGRHEPTLAIAVHAEGFRDGRAFLETAERVGRDKPIVLLKGARSESGRGAARSHTGALAGDYDRLRAGLDQAGVVVVERADELVPVAHALARQPPARGTGGVAVLTDGGGQGALAADALSGLGVPLARLSESSRTALRERLGSPAAVTNPVDLAGAADADPRAFDAALEILAADPGVAGVLVVGLFGGYALRFAPSLADAELAAAESMATLVRSARLPLVVHTMYAGTWSPPLEVLGREGVPVIEPLDVACRCVAETWRAARRSAAHDRPRESPATVTSETDANARDLVDRLLAEGRATLTELEARALIGGSVPFVEATVCRSAEEAAAAAVAVGGRVALKVVCSAIPHKTDTGCVLTGVEGAADASRAYRDIMARAALALRGSTVPVEGVIVSEMLTPPLAEILIGAVRDPALGPVLTVGAGGVWVEALADVAHVLLPAGEADVDRAIDRLRCSVALDGGRGAEAVDRGALIAVAQAVGRCLLVDARVAEVEINPLFVYADRVCAVDARAYLVGSGVGAG